MYHALIQFHLALALIHFFPGINYIFMLPYTVSLHKILIIATGQLSDEKCKRKKCCIHQPLTCIKTKYILVHVTTFRTVFELAPEMLKLKLSSFITATFDWTVTARNVLELYRWSIIIAKTHIFFCNMCIYFLIKRKPKPIWLFSPILTMLGTISLCQKNHELKHWLVYFVMRCYFQENNVFASANVVLNC